MEGDVVELVTMAFGAALVPGVAGLGLLWLLRRRSVETQVVVVALVSVMGTAAGVLVASQQMFLSTHDLDVLVVVITSAATVGVLAALVLGARVGRATRSLTELTRRIGANEPGPQVDLGAPGEFARLARELDDMQTRLAGAEAARRELVAWVSHDLRTPLAGIRVLVEALEDGVVDDSASVARYHRTLRDQTDRLAALVEEMFELSRLHAGTLRLQQVPIGLAEVIADAVDVVRPAAEGKEVELRCAVDDAEVQVAPRELGRAVRNIVENAVRHSPRGGVVDISATIEGSLVTIVVADTGAGINPADLGRIFEPGFSGNRARTPGSVGEGQRTGLGLAIARGFVEAHGGSLSASNGEVGARFRLVVPVEASVPVPAELPSAG
jgi:signal transduction histidine kinase